MEIIVIIVGALFVLLTTYFIAFRRKRTVKLTADEYNLLMRRKFDNYDLRSFLVRGDFNTTFEAFDHDRKTTVALRILDHSKIYHDQIVQQFNLKGEMLKFLAERYPGERFVQGIKFGTVKIEEEPRPYIVSDYVQGVGLHDILDRYGRLAPRDTLEIIRQLGESVSLAHAQRIWVREIAPQNVLLTLNPARKLVVTLANVGVPFKSLPSEFSAEAKKGYYSPEDRRDELVDERSDVYALAALTFRMLQGYDPSARETGEPWNDFTIPLEPSLADEPHLRPANVETFLRTLTGLQSAKSATRLVAWDREIPRVIAKRVKMKIKRTDAEVIEQAPARRRPAFAPVSSQTKDRFIVSFLTGLFVTFFMWIGKKIEGVLASPKKFVLGLGVLLLGAFVALWYFVYSPERGSIIVKVDALTNKTPPEAVKECIVVIEARDEKSGTLAPVRLSSDYADSGGEGRIVLRTSRRGKVLVDYKGHFDRQSTLLTLTAWKNGEFMEGHMTKRLAADDIVAAFHLRPERTGMISVTVSDTRRLIRPGVVPPENFSLEIIGTGVSGAPLGSSKFWFDNTMLTPAGAGKAQTPDQKFTLESRHQLRYQIEDSATVTLAVRGSQNPVLELEVAPSKWKIVQPNSSLASVVSLRKRSSSEREVFLFQVFDEDGSPAEGLEMFLNGQSIGKTSAQGKVDYPVFDVEGFWGQQPTLTIDLHPYNTNWNLSKEYPLQRKENAREFQIRIADIRPDN